MKTLAQLGYGRADVPRYLAELGMDRVLAMTQRQAVRETVGVYFGDKEWYDIIEGWIDDFGGTIDWHE